MTRALCLTAVFLLAGCSGLSSNVTDSYQQGQDFARDTVSGALDLGQDLTQPVLDAAAEAKRRADQLGEGIEELQQGSAKIRGSMTASGITF